MVRCCQQGQVTPTLFTLSPKQKAGTIPFGGTQLKDDEEATYLGVDLTKGRPKRYCHLTRGRPKRYGHLTRGRPKRYGHFTKGRLKRYGHCKNISKGQNHAGYRSQTCWYHLGSKRDSTEGTARLHLEYDSTAWSTTAKVNQQALDKVQNQALRLVTGAMMFTPIIEEAYKSPNA